jgi:hypothetical protein
VKSGNRRPCLGPIAAPGQALDLLVDFFSLLRGGFGERNIGLP